MKDYMEIELSNGVKTKVSIDDFEYLNKWKWKQHTGGYVVRSAGSKKQGYRAILMHRVVNKTPKGLETDHINRDKLDNRRENLRSVTRSENEFNKSPSSKNTSGVTGVFWDKDRRKWLCRVGSKHIGRYNTKIEAKRAREQYLSRLQSMKNYLI